MILIVQRPPWGDDSTKSRNEIVPAAPSLAEKSTQAIQAVKE
jgi:hypothetical protein